MEHHHRGSQLPPPPSPPSSSDTSFPILAISILGILITSILLLSYYVFAVRCRLSWRHSDVVARLSRPRSRRRGGDWQPYQTAAAENRGLGEEEIRAIPTFRYLYGGVGLRASSSSGSHECSVCLNEFQEQERIRLLPCCLHVFHIDCIDTWLQTNANCPLCRASITPAATAVPIDKLLASVPRRIDQVAIDVREDGGGEKQSETAAAAVAVKGRKVHRHGSFGDECIDARSKARRQLSVQPMRRSFSVGSSSDRQLLMAVQKMLQQNQHFRDPAGGGEGSSSSSGIRIRRAFFSFHRHSRSAVLPVEIEQ